MKNSTVFCLLIGIGMLSFNNLVKADGVKNYYINGVGIGDDTIEKSLRSAKAIEIQAGIGYVGLLENNSKGRFFDLFEAATQVTRLDRIYEIVSSVVGVNQSLLDAFSSVIEKHTETTEQKLLLRLSRLVVFAKENKQSVWKAIKNPLDEAKYFGELGFKAAEIAKLQTINALEGKIGTLVQVISTIISNIPDYKNSIAYEDKEAMRRTIDTELNKNHKNINIIAHSQGNLFANSVLSSKFSNENRIKLLSVSNPDFYVYGDGRDITLSEDLVARFLFPFPFHQNWQTNYTAVQKGLDIFLAKYVINSFKYKEVFAHGFQEAYLHPDSYSEKFIVSVFQDNHKALATIINRPSDPPEEESRDLSLGESRQSSWSDQEVSKYRSGRYAKRYNLRLSSCRKIQIDLESTTTDAYLYLHTNGVRIAKNDDGGGRANSRVALDLVAGTYEVEATTYHAGKTGSFTLKTTDLGSGNCTPQNTSSSDITVSNATVDKTSVNAGERVRVSARQHYAGNVLRRDLPEDPRLGFYFSKDASWDNEDRLLRSNSSSIGADDLYDDEKASIYIPKYANPGDYHILFVADYLKKIVETNENNNVSAVGIKVKAQTSSGTGDDDIYVSDISIDDNIVTNGDRVTVRARVNYTGSRTKRELGTVYTSYYISSRSNFDSSAIYLDYDTSSIGSDDAFDDESERVTIPDNLSRGLYYMHVVVDDKNGRRSVLEINEQNNHDRVLVSIY